MLTLLVDPSLTARRAYTHVLREMGHPDILEASSIDEALPLLEGSAGTPVTLVLSEWDLPGEGGGKALLEAVRERNGDARIPVVIISARAAHRDVLDALEAGAQDYLLKPATRETLRDHLEGVLQATSDGEDGAAADTGADARSATLDEPVEQREAA